METVIETCLDLEIFCVPDVGITLNQVWRPFVEARRVAQFGEFRQVNGEQLKLRFPLNGFKLF